MMRNYECSTNELGVTANAIVMNASPLVQV